MIQLRTEVGWRIKAMIRGQAVLYQRPGPWRRLCKLSLLSLHPAPVSNFHPPAPSLGEEEREQEWAQGCLSAIDQGMDMFVTAWIIELLAETWQRLVAQPWPERNHQVSRELEILIQRAAEELCWHWVSGLPSSQGQDHVLHSIQGTGLRARSSNWSPLCC